MGKGTGLYPVFDKPRDWGFRNAWLLVNNSPVLNRSPLCKSGGICILQRWNMCASFRWQALPGLSTSEQEAALHVELGPSALLLTVSAKALQCVLGLCSQVEEYYCFYEHRRICPQVGMLLFACLFCYIFRRVCYGISLKQMFQRSLLTYSGSCPPVLEFRFCCWLVLLPSKLPSPVLLMFRFTQMVGIIEQGSWELVQIAGVQVEVLGESIIS